mgnify:CR=1 FL=1
MRENDIKIKRSIVSAICNNAPGSIKSVELCGTRRKSLYKTIESLVAAVEAKDKYTEGHSRRVSEYAVMIAQGMGFSKEHVESIRLAGILHDIGKIGIRDSIILNPGKLTPDEYEEIKKHPLISGKILGSVGLSEMIINTITFHHERYDGKGYPFCLSKNKINIEAQIVSVADAFDAMTSRRSYKKAMTKNQAIKELIRCKGTQFNPVVVDTMVKIMNISEKHSKTDTPRAV